ncbi:putative phylloplanin [Helianthus annuus]|uniref:Phylloplanin n=1 Tax=Helianthus annuus TaxID=4232 RepID=A0A251VB72_HELAN|nr:phylloplanin [Helianthus annuus]KAF5816341.1 putative phylloplanin [Helianthus annuus]KAJ0594650.1 putative phylloplanin [Helianthus annuus]KAJ0602905.1 putative phylloplanin [Helianthus annuus]KAJ0609698.1 putative phylloplanin [Helianthus annuus]KAJ0775474.1 putative phylloplanin [Helianthus annuus]
MAMKSFILLIPILIVIFVGTQAEAQLPPTTAGASFNISGIVLCSTDSSVYNVATPTPPFPNATVQLLCDGNVIASTTTSESGGFSFLVRLQATLTTVLASCKVDVVTPLSACNATLPSTSPSLEASLRATIQSSVTTSKIITSPFQVMGSL